MSKINKIWLSILIIAVSGQWAFHKYEISDKLFTKSEEREIAYWVAPMDPNYVSDKPGKSPMGMDLVPVYADQTGEQGSIDMSSVIEIPGVDYYYTCGMHPNVRENEPGNCPICGMNLVKKNIGRGSSSGTVEIDPVTVQNMGVRTVKVENKIMVKKIRAFGKITYDEGKIASLTSKVTGWAEKLYINHLGQFVKKGDPVLDIYSPELVSTQEEYLRARELNRKFKENGYDESIIQVEALLNSTRKRLEYWDISAEQIEELEENGEVKKNLTLYSPINGIVTMRMINEGEQIKPNMRLFEISDISTVWVLADIYEFELSWIKAGQKARMELSYYPGKVFNGIIDFIYPYLESKTRTIKVRFVFDNADLALKPEMYANVYLESSSQEKNLVVPLSAVIRSGERNVVIIDKGEGRFEPRNVTIGIESEDQYSILSGLEEGEIVVTSAQFLIDSESRLIEAQAKLIADLTGKAESSGDEDTAITVIGDGEIKYTCPMPEDMVFGDGEYECPKCGMTLEAMDEEKLKNYDIMKESHEINHVHAKKE